MGAGSNEIAIKYLQGLLGELRKQSAQGIVAKARKPMGEEMAPEGEMAPELSDEELMALESAESPSVENPMPEDDEEKLKLR